MHSLEMALDFVRALTGDPDTPCTWQTFDDRSTKRPELARIMHGPLREHAEKLDGLNRRGAGVFVTVNETDLHGRREENITALRALFADSDDGDFPPGIPMPPPSIMVQSARGQHAYWLLDPGAPVDAFTDAQSRIAAALGTDPRIKDLPRVMRLPGFDHNKAAPFPVALVEAHQERRYEFWTLLEGIPELPPPMVAIPPAAAAPRHAATGSGPDLVERARLWLERRDPAIEGQGGDNHTFSTACALVNDFCLDEGDAMALLREWNRSCSPPWDEKDLQTKLAHARKYANRSPGSKRDAPRPHSATYSETAAGPDPTVGYDVGAPPPGENDIPALAKYRGLTPNALGMLLMRDERIVCDANDNVYHFGGTHWRPLTFGGLRSMFMRYEEVEDTSTRRRAEAANFTIDMTRRGDLITWNRIPATEIPFRNGMFDFIEGTIEPHRPEDFLDRVMPIDYEPGATSHLWEQLLADWFGDDDDQGVKVKSLQEFFGYVLMQHARYKKALVLYGDSDTGKSMVAQTLRMMVGDGNVCQIGIDKMNDPKHLAPIVGKMLNLVTELPEDSLVADGGFKQLVSTQEPVQIDEKWKAQITYVPTAKHVFATNNLPDINDKTRATYNRLLIVKFNHVIPPELQDRDLMAKIELEMPGIVNWSIEGARRLTQAAGEFTTIPESERIIEEYRVEQNPMQMFVDSQMARHPGARIEFKNFCDRFNNWNPGRRPWSSRAIGKALTAMGLHRQNSNNTRLVVGLMPRDETN